MGLKSPEFLQLLKRVQNSLLTSENYFGNFLGYFFYRHWATFSSNILVTLVTTKMFYSFRPRAKRVSTSTGKFWDATSRPSWLVLHVSRFIRLRPRPSDSDFRRNKSETEKKFGFNFFVFVLKRTRQIPAPGPV